MKMSFLEDERYRQLMLKLNDLEALVINLKTRLAHLESLSPMSTEWEKTKKGAINDCKKSE